MEGTSQVLMEGQQPSDVRARAERGDISQSPLVRKRAPARRRSRLPMVAGKKQTRSCLICREIRRFLFTPVSVGQRKSRTLGNIEDIAQQFCAVCSRIFSQIDKSPQSGRKNDQAYLWKYGYCHSINVSLRGRFSNDLALLIQGDVEQSFGYAYPVDPQWISISGLRERLSRCLEDHRTVCQVTTSARAIFRAWPSWVIDVNRMCIIPATTGMVYAALSYVWGRTTVLRLLKCNRDELQKDGVLNNPSYSAHLPRTVKDAIQLVRLLGERYLWVDSLCIIQDDYTSLHHELNSMASIYANALVTIVAAAGKNANSGLHGIRGVSKARVFKQERYEIADGYQIAELQRLSLDPSLPWRTRAWTFQEDLFSTRKIVFDRNVVRWECSKIWCEDTGLPVNWAETPQRRSSAKVEPYFSSLPLPNIDRYLSMILSYNTRTLTYPEDCIRAFSGITTAFSYSFEGGFICGLMELFFDEALLWRSAGAVQRRKASKASASKLLPSWSWVGWFGEIDFRSWPTDYMRSSTSTVRYESTTSCRLIPRLQWYCSESITGARRPLQSSTILQQYKLNSLDPRKPLPTGWSRRFVHTRPLSELNLKVSDAYRYHKEKYIHAFDKDNTVYYIHDSDQSARYWYPVPVPDHRVPLSVRAPEPFLFCRTQRAFLYLAERINKSRPCTTLRTEQGDWAGGMSLNSHGEYSDALLTNIIAMDKRIRCEIILLSEGHALNSAFDEDGYLVEWNHPDRPKDTRLYE